MRLVLIAIVMAAVFWPGAADAQARDSAQVHFEKGAALYYDGRYSEALVEFQLAQAADSNPLFLMNIALVQWRLDHLGAAIDAAERAARSPDLDAKLASQNSARTWAWRVTLTARDATRNEAVTITQPGTRELASARAATEVPPAAVREEPRRNRGPLLWLGMTAAGVGTAALGGWGVMEVTLTADFRALQDARDAGNAAQYEVVGARIQRRQAIAKPLLLGGGALALTGLTMLLVNGLTASETAPTVTFLDGTTVVVGFVRLQ